MKTIVRSSSVYPFFTNNAWQYVRNFEKANVESNNLVSPAVNIGKDETRICIRMAVPGLEKSDFDVTVLERTIEIKVQKETDTKIEWFQRDFDYTHFRKVFVLPKEIDRERIELKYDAGVLEINLYKIEKIEESRKLLDV